ncbi:MAG: bifunctional riboflavin kinase/FAD synthetase [Haliscomenobacter sp.]|nr:bifunctional riboflavin kinase/FAD synthetase [Haliscomenobacter sp.]
MKVHENLDQLPKFHNAVVTIGSFDGVHKGHQKIIAQVNQLAHSIGGESVLVTFHPHPRMVVYPREGAVDLITTLEEKVQMLRGYGIDHLVVAPFTVEFSQLSADEYIEKFLVGHLQPKYIVIGFDHKFGLSRQGDINYLRWHGKRFGFEVVEIEQHEVEEVAVSSTKIRRAIERGDVQAAAVLMGHYPTLTGVVVHGEKVGKQLGFPTANIQLAEKHKLVPPDGVYAVFVRLKNEHYGGMLYIGSRPTLGNRKARTIEVNIFGWNQAIYGETIQVELVDFVRGDLKFESLDALRRQLKKDQESTEERLLHAPRLGPLVEKKETPEVAVVILNYNGRAYLEQFLPALLHSTFPNLQVIVADNCSSDDSMHFLETNYPQVSRIPLKKNYGFAEGYNLALRQIRADYYILLNSDIEVTPGWIEPIIGLMEQDKTIAAAQPKIRSFARKECFEYAGASGGWLDHLGYPFCRGRILATTEEDHGQYDQIQEIFWATGAAFFVRATVFHNLGGFDGNYFAHAEEIDLCWRMKRAGYKVVAHPGSVVYHVGGGTLDYLNPFKTYLNFRNTLYTITKNEPWEKLLWLLPLRVVLDGVASLLFLSQGRFGHIWSIIKAHWTFFPRLLLVLDDRWKYNERIQKHRISVYPRKTGRYPGAIVWDYYIRKRRHFSEIIRR